jgi:hypothetical protein
MRYFELSGDGQLFYRNDISNFSSGLGAKSVCIFHVMEVAYLVR